MIDITKAFSLPFKDPQWPQKLLIGGTFFFIVIVTQILGGFLHNAIGLIVTENRYESATLIKTIGGVFSFFISILSVITIAIPVGYILQSSHNEIKDEGQILPEWDSKFIDYFKYGMYFYAIKILYSFIIALIVSIPLAISALIFNLYHGNLVISIISLIFIVLFVAPFFIFYLVIFPFIITSYADNFDFKDAFRWDKILAAISRVMPDYILSIGISIAILIMVPLLLIMLTCTCIGPLLLPFLILPIFVIIMNLFSQAYRKSGQGT